MSETVDWLSVTPANGQTPANVTLTVDPFGKEVGEYRATLLISSNEAANSPIEVPVVMTVAPAPSEFKLFLPIIPRRAQP